MLNRAAVIGVPNSAENTALIPHRVSMCLSLSSSLRIFPIDTPILPPIWRAAPSRPEEPPNKCVITVDTNMSGAIREGISFSTLLMEPITRFVPLECLIPHMR